MKKNNDFISWINVLWIIAIVFIAGTVFSKEVDRIFKENLDDLGISSENFKEMAHYTAFDLSTALNKQVEKINSNPDDIKVSDINGLTGTCSYIESYYTTNDYLNYLWSFDSIKPNCQIITEFYNDNFGSIPIIEE